MSFDQSFDDCTRAIKVLVVPIGRNSLFDQHFQTVSDLSEIPLYELNRPSHSVAASCPFKHFNWTDGALRFDFLRYDRVLVGGELNDFQSSKRILMIMGIINYPEIGGVESKIEEELNFYARRHPHLLLRRIFVFNYAFDDPSQQKQQHANSPKPPRPLKSFVVDPNSLVIFPPEGICEGGVSMIEVHLKEVMSNSAVSILQAFEDQMRACEDARLRNCLPALLPLSTLFDEVEEQLQQQKPVSIAMTVTGRPNRKLYRKRPSGRIHKWMGDLSMQVCSPRDALEHYSASISECRALNETLWLGGALEGYASAVLLLLQLQSVLQLPLEEVLGRDLRSALTASDGLLVMSTSEGGQPTADALEKIYRCLVEDRINEAAAIYSTNGIYCLMEAECLLRAAKMHESSPFAATREGRVLAYLVRAMSVPGLSVPQQLECVLEAALVCSRLGLRRKHTLFLFIAALRSVEAENLSIAMALLQYACLSSTADVAAGCVTPAQLMSSGAGSELGFVQWSAQLPPPGDPLSAHGSAPVTAAAHASWTSIRLALLSSVCTVASEQGDVLSTARYTAGLLRMISEVERKHLDRRRDWVDYAPEQMFLVEQDAGSDVNSRKFDPFTAAAAAAVASEGDSKDVCSVQFTSSLSPPPRRQASIIEGVLALPPVADGMQQGLSDMAAAQMGTLPLAAQSAESSRRVAVPDLPALLSFLPLLLASRASSAGTAEESGPGDPPLLSERLRRRPSDSLQHYSAPSGKEESSPSTGLNADPSSLADMLEYLLQLQSRRSCSLDLQQETCGLFARVSKLIPPGSLLVSSPVHLLRLEPIELMGSRRPVPVSDALDALSATRRKVDLITQYVRNGRRASNSQEASISSSSSSSNHTPAESAPTSSLFYDPFAAKRRKELDSKKEAAGLCWAVGEVCTVRALLSNPLSVPVLLDSVFPVFRGTARHRVFPAAAAAVQIPPCCDSFEVLLSVSPEEVGSMQLVGLQTVCNNVTSYFEVDEHGYCKSSSCSPIDTSSTSKPLLSSSLIDASSNTKSIRVVPAVHPLRVDTSWVEGDRASWVDGDNTAASRLEGIDVVKTLDLQPGEDRTESIRIVTIGSLAGDNSKKTMKETKMKETMKTGRRDCRVTVRECRACEPSKVAESATSTVTVVDFSGVLCSRLDDDSSPAIGGINTISAESYRLVSFNGCLDDDTPTDGSQPPHVVVSELSLEFHADTAVRFIDIFVEVVAVDDSTADLVAELRGRRIDTCEDCALLPEEFFRQFPADRFLLEEEGCLLTTTAFSRVLSIRILFQAAPGVRLTRYDRLLSDAASSDVHLPVSAHEASRVSAAISEALARNGCCPLSDHHPPGEISLLQPRIKVMFEFTNESAAAVSLGTKESQLLLRGWRGGEGSPEGTALLPASVSYELLSASQSPVLVLPPRSIRRLVVDCDADAADELEQPSLWLWGSRAARPPSSDCRCGRVLASSQIVAEFGLSSGYAPLSMRSGPLHSILSPVPLVSIRTYLHKFKGDKSSALPMVDGDFFLSSLSCPPGDLYYTTVASVATFTVEIMSTTRRSVPQELQLVIIAVSSEVPVVDDDDDDGVGPDPHSTSGPPCVVLTGKRLSRHRLLPQSSDVPSPPSAATLHHSVQLRFPRCGSFTVYPFVSSSGPSGSSGSWWTSAGAYVRVVVGTTTA